MEDVGKFLWTYGLFDSNLVYFMDYCYMYFVEIWYIFVIFGIVLAYCTRQNLATLVLGLAFGLPLKRRSSSLRESPPSKFLTQKNLAQVHSFIY
jgi:hypothetical protein